MPGEVITFHVGQCGNQIGLQYWNQLAIEHGINLDGTKNSRSESDKILIDDYPKHENINARPDLFFTLSSNNTYTPRAILIDLEPSVIGKFKNNVPMINPRNIHLSEQGSGAANNWQQGYDYGLQHQEELMDLIDRECDKCENLAAFQLMHGVAGGTGSGVGSLILELLNDRYGSKKTMQTASIFPSSEKTSDVVVQPYNSILTLRRLIEHSDATFVFENDALNSIETSLFGVTSHNFSKSGKDSAFDGVNKLISFALASVSNPLRFPSYMYSSNESILSSLIPTPDLKFLSLSIAPFSTWGKLTAPHNPKYNFSELNEYDMILELLNDKYKMNKVDGSSLKYISILNYIMSDNINQNDIRRGTLKAQQRAEFVPWTSSAIHTAHCHISPHLLSSPNRAKQKSVQGIQISNNSSVAHVLAKVVKQFDLLAKREAYINFYTSSNDRDERRSVLDEFYECRDAVISVINEYKSCGSMDYLEDEAFQGEDSM